MIFQDKTQNNFKKFGWENNNKVILLLDDNNNQQSPFLTISSVKSQRNIQKNDKQLQITQSTRNLKQNNSLNTLQQDVKSSLNFQISAYSDQQANSSKKKFQLARKLEIQDGDSIFSIKTQQGFFGGSKSVQGSLENGGLFKQISFKYKVDYMDVFQKIQREELSALQVEQKNKSFNNLDIIQQQLENKNKYNKMMYKDNKQENQLLPFSQKQRKQEKLPPLTKSNNQRIESSKRNLSDQIKSPNPKEEQTNGFYSQTTIKNLNQIDNSVQKILQEQTKQFKIYSKSNKKLPLSSNFQEDLINNSDQRNQQSGFCMQSSSSNDHQKNNQSFKNLQSPQNFYENIIIDDKKLNQQISNYSSQIEFNQSNNSINSSEIFQNEEEKINWKEAQQQNCQVKCFKYTQLIGLHPIVEIINFEDGSHEMKKEQQKQNESLLNQERIKAAIGDANKIGSKKNNQNQIDDANYQDNIYHQKYTFKPINQLSELGEEHKTDIRQIKEQDIQQDSEDITIEKGKNKANKNSSNSSSDNSPLNIININDNKINQVVNYSIFNNINNNIEKKNYQAEKQSPNFQQQLLQCPQIPNQERSRSSSSNTRAQMKQQNCKFYEGDETLFEKYSLEKCFAKSNSYVYEARNRENDTLTECVKQVRINERDCTYEQFINECNILEKTKLFPHQSMIKYYGYFITKENNESQILIGNIVMERGKQSLKMFMQQRQNQNKKQLEELSISQFDTSQSNKIQTSSEIDGAYFNEVEVVDFMKCLIDVHHHLQKNNIAHRDIKPQNILIVEDDDQNINYKVCDVGSGVGLESSSQYTRTRTVAGTEVYMSPEVYTGIYNTVTQYNPFKSDVFSLGLVFLEFLTFKLVDKDKKVRLDKDKYMAEVKELRHEAKKRYKYIFGLNKILKQMLVYNQNDRITFQELYQQVFEENRLTILSSRQQQIERLSSSIWEEVMNKDNIMELLEDSVKNNVSSFRIELSSVQPKQLIEQFTKLKETIKRIMLKKIFLSLDQILLTVEQSKLLGEAISKAQLLVNLELSLFQSSLGEQGCIHLLQGVSACVKLKVLKINISNNMIGSQGIINGLQHLTKLTQLSELILDLSQNQLGLDCVDTICNVLNCCNQIKKLELKLANNSITYKGVKHLKESFENLKQLQSFYLNLSQNQFFADQGFIQVGNLIENSIQLRELTVVVQVNSIQNRGLKEFSLCLQNLVNLRHFNLFIWGNQIEGAGFEQLGKAIQALENLESIQLNLTNNYVSSIGLSEIEKGLTNKKKITKIRLQLEGCGLVSDDMIYVGRIMSIQQLKTVSLNLQNNKLDDKAALFIASGLQHSKCIEEFNLNLSDSVISGQSHLQIWKFLLLGKFLNSVYYSARNNQLEDKTLDQIIKMGETLKKLRYFCLDFESNNFTEGSKKKFKEDMLAYFKKNKVLELII